MIQSFKGRMTEDIFDQLNSKAARRIPKALWPVIRRKLYGLAAAHAPQDLHTPGNRLEQLGGHRKGTYSIRVNEQYRITFRFETGQAHDVCCEDYH